ncbi:MAG TPA: cupredoxin family copper-binding protein [Telluria sp.]|nr:cupredoxin family copper-binding protein [Telluria sp.]
MKPMIAAALAVAVLAAPAHAAPAVHTVVIDGMRFIPQTLEVKAGDTVIWRNKDPFPHNAVAPGSVLASPDIATGGSWKFKATKRGTYAYLCTLHRTMTGTLIVK